MFKLSKLQFLLISSVLSICIKGQVKHRQSGPSPSSFVCPSNYGYFPNPDNCKSYYYCWSGSSYLQYCPSGQTFSPINRTCSSYDSCSDSPVTSSSLETEASNFISEYPPARPHSTFRPWYSSTAYPGQPGGQPGGQPYPGGINQPYPVFPVVPNAGTGCYQECCTYRSILVRSICSLTKNLINLSLRKFTRVRGNFADVAQRIGLSNS